MANTRLRPHKFLGPLETQRWLGAKQPQSQAQLRPAVTAPTPISSSGKPRKLPWTSSIKHFDVRRGIRLQHHNTAGIYRCPGWMPLLKYFTFFSIRRHFGCQRGLTLASLTINTDWALKRACSARLMSNTKRPSAKRRAPRHIPPPLPSFRGLQHSHPKLTKEKLLPMSWTLPKKKKNTCRKFHYRNTSPLGNKGLKKEKKKSLLIPQPKRDYYSYT